MDGPSADKDAWARLSGRITRACLDNGMSAPDACETAAVVLPVLEAWLAESESGACRRCGVSKGAAIAGILCNPPHARSHDFPPRVTPPERKGV